MGECSPNGLLITVTAVSIICAKSSSGRLPVVFRSSSGRLPVFDLIV